MFLYIYIHFYMKNFFSGLDSTFRFKMYFHIDGNRTQHSQVFYNIRLNLFSLRKRWINYGYIFWPYSFHYFIFV